MAKQYLFFFDVETTGLPKKRGLDYRYYNNWPRIVSICWLITDHSGKVYEEFYELIKPNGFTIPYQAEDIHGISTAKAKRDGIKYEQMVRALEKSLGKYNLSHLVAHNIEFDINVLLSELLRNKNSILTTLLRMPTACTMKSSTSYCRLPHKNTRYRGYKWPKLSELHWKLFQRGLLLEHDAKEDILATKNCFFKLQQMGIIQVSLQSSKPRDAAVKKSKTVSKKADEKNVGERVFSPKAKTAERKIGSEKIASRKSPATRKKSAKARKLAKEIVDELNAIAQNQKKKAKAKSAKKSESVSKKTESVLKKETQISRITPHSNPSKVNANSSENISVVRRKQLSKAERIVEELNAIGRRNKAAGKTVYPIRPKRERKPDPSKSNRTKINLSCAVVFWFIAIAFQNGFAFFLAVLSTVSWFFRDR
jgi:DNA polymerase-3 subunit epsilon